MTGRYFILLHDLQRHNEFKIIFVLFSIWQKINQNGSIQLFAVMPENRHINILFLAQNLLPLSVLYDAYVYRRFSIDLQKITTDDIEQNERNTKERQLWMTRDDNGKKLLTKLDD